MRSAISSEFKKVVKEDKEFLDKVIAFMKNAGPSKHFDHSSEFTRKDLQQKSIKAVGAATRAGGNMAADYLATKDRTLLCRKRTRIQGYGIAHTDYTAKKLALEALETRIDTLVLDDV